ncbi:DUF6048 family protein [Flavobacterium agricola]|uniref:DUF6048 family protein n=1 Tax=Flavobacterium agricola TaxID=2870839 RepID=A0ABY6M2N6_9FLAO|nr:DUF6048 family protein [Flavobacterium agricola]UYW01690.1 DUF6048 family protein [Flavobacterium agricola]
MKYILKYCFSLFLLGTTLGSFAQENDANTDPKTMRYAKPYGLRLGVDLNRLAKNLYEEKYKGFAVTGDYRINTNLYVAAELGMEDKYNQTDPLTYTTSGEFIKLGIDYNVYKNWLDMNNMIYVGGRLAYSTFKQNLESYTIRDTNHYFESITFPGQEFKGLNATWVEFVAGVKAEVLNNLYLGFSAQLNFLVSDTKIDNFENLYIPGYNKKYSGNVGVGFNYTISYLIPLYKK